MIEIAIDGTAASGKGTLAKKLAKKLTEIVTNKESRLSGN